jgi:hypothetical protein
MKLQAEREREKEHNWAVLEAHKTLGFYFVSLNLFKNLILRFFFSVAVVFISLSIEEVLLYVLFLCC